MEHVHSDAVEPSRMLRVSTSSAFDSVDRAASPSRGFDIDSVISASHIRAHHMQQYVELLIIQTQHFEAEKSVFRVSL